MLTKKKKKTSVSADEKLHGYKCIAVELGYALCSIFRKSVQKKILCCYNYVINSHVSISISFKDWSVH